MVAVSALTLAAALAFSQEDARFAYGCASDLVAECTPRDAGTAGGRRAARHILARLKSAGAEARTDTFAAQTPVGLRKFTNVIAEWEYSPSNDWVVVVSHYDTKRGVLCPGANDGASTSGLLLAFARILANNASHESPLAPNPMNISLMWLDGEECFRAYSQTDGLWGSRRAASELAKSGRKVRAVICVDMLGDRKLDIVLPRNTTAWLRRATLNAARKVGEGARVREIGELVKDDHLPFLVAGFDAIDLIDFNYGSYDGANDYWHTPQDTCDKISDESLFAAGRIVAALIGECAARYSIPRLGNVR